MFIPYFAIPFFFIFQRKDKRKLWQKGAMSIEPEPIANTSLSESEHKGLPINVIKTFINLELPTLTQKILLKYIQMVLILSKLLSKL